LVGKPIFAIRDVLFGRGPVRRIQLSFSGAQVFLEPSDGVLVPTVLFEATALVEEVGRVFRVDEQLGENVNALGIVATEARLSRRALLGLFTRRKRGRGRERQDGDNDRGAAKKTIDYTSGGLAHSGESLCETWSVASE
jgi:hypothetical protein